MEDSFLYNREFHKTREKHKAWQLQMALQISKYLNIKSVIDFGCSTGFFLEGFYQQGLIIQGFEIGYEYSQEFTEPLIRPFIKYGDVGKSIVCNTAECSFSIEVAEHIKPEDSTEYIRNLCINSKKYIILSAAPIGQGGIGHINCKPYSFWISKITEYDFIYQKEKTIELLDIINKNVVKVPKWIKSNLMVFEKL